MNAMITMMRNRVAAGMDPLTGRTMQTTGPIHVIDGTPVDGTGREVTLSQYGDWVYID